MDTFVDLSTSQASPKTGVIDNSFGISHLGGVHYFNDTILIFSCNSLEGYGGHDIFISKLKEGNWSEPMNLGPAINSAYDEISPFLAKNGRRIYFSSNRETSIGGYDIFMADYDDNIYRWGKSKNLLDPINSPADDINFVLSDDGLRAWFSSSRYDGYGGFDLYSCFFKSKIEEHLAYSNPLTFDEIEYDKTSHGAISQNENAIEENEGPTIFVANEIRDFTVSPLFYDENDFILSNANKKIIDKYVNLLLSYPSLKILLTAHSDGTDSREFDHYFSIKRAEKLFAHMIQNGVPANRIVIRGCGSQYPIAMNYQYGKPLREGQRLNRRIDVRIFNYQNMPLNVTYADPRVSERIALPLGEKYNQTNQGLGYRLELIRTNQPFTESSFLESEYPAVEKEMHSSIYKYVIGNYNSYVVANNQKAIAMGQGLTDARIIPYFDGIRLSRDQLSAMTDQFPDLIYYLEGNP